MPSPKIQRPRGFLAAIGPAAVAAVMTIVAMPGAAAAGPREPAQARLTLDTKAQAVEPAPKPLLPSEKMPTPKPSADGPGTDIVGGSPAQSGEFPYFVSLQRSVPPLGDHFCGGSLMSTTKVLTAAHCVEDTLPSSLQVSIGGTALNPGNGVPRDVSAVAVHPDFDPFTLRNDVAVLTLATPVVRTDRSLRWLRPARGNELGLVDVGDNATVIGHGRVCTGCALSNQLLKVAVPILADATMAGLYGPDYDAATMLGAGFLGGGQGSCNGDSGGPLLIASSPQPVQIGTVSFGSLAGCAAPNGPGGYGEIYQGALAAFVDGQVARPANDRFAAGLTLSGNAGSIVGSNENATADPAEPAGETTVWYNWTPTLSGGAKITANQHGFDSELNIYTGSSVSALTPVAFNDDANGTLQSEVEFFAVAGTTYRIRVDGYGFDYGQFRLSYGLNRPTGDDFAGAQLLTGALGTVTGTTSTATGQAGEPSAGTGWADATLWYAWVAPESGTARFATTGSSFDTTLAAYTGTALPGLVEAAHNDDFNQTLQSLISFPVVAGSVYRIQVGGYSNARGSVGLEFTVNPEANDLFSAAQVITGGSGTVVGSNVRAIGEPGEPAMETAADSTIWYRWTAPSTGTVHFNTCGSGFDTTLAAATGTSVIALMKVAVNDNSCGAQSAISFAATATRTYYLWVDGANAARGSVVLSWS
jgi:hypothetical protein